MNIHIAKTAIVHKTSTIGDQTKIWNFAHIRENTKIGKNVIVGMGVYIDAEVVIGDYVKIQNYACIYKHTTIYDRVFIGPHTCIINDKLPRSTNADNKLKEPHEWNPGKVTIEEGASIGASCIILPNITIGQYALVGAGSVVTTDITPYSMVSGNPAKHMEYICKCGLIKSAHKKYILRCHCFKNLVIRT